jgi:dolichol-phosphate mannosyltransferase
MSKNLKSISIIIPVHNEEGSLDWFFGDLKKFLTDELQNFDHQYIFIDDGSSDSSLKIIKGFAKSNKSVRYISFSKNFGKEAATSAGLSVAGGDAAIMIDADGQHPINLIKDFVAKWEEGFQIVVGVRGSNRNEGLIKKYGSKFFYKILGFLSDSEVTHSATDFRLLDRRVIDEFNKLTEHNRITRGLIDWLGFKRDYVSFHAGARRFGKATYSNTKLLKLAINSFIAHSTKPLKIIGALGMVVTLLSAIFGLFVLTEEWILHDPMGLAFTGTALLAIFLSFLTGITLTCQGLLALYIETIHSEAQNRPLFVVAESNLSSN